MNALLVIDDPLPENDFFQPGDGIHPGQAGYNQLGLLWFNAITASGSLLDPPIEGLPAAPTGLSVTVASPSRINLAWTDNSSNEAVYRVRRRQATGGPWEEVAMLPACSSGHAVKGLRTAVDSYMFAVLASNLRGDSA
jgi:hypothetical protein